VVLTAAMVHLVTEWSPSIRTEGRRDPNLPPALP
jgi:hypothetical protein